MSSRLIHSDYITGTLTFMTVHHEPMRVVTREVDTFTCIKELIDVEK